MTGYLRLRWSKHPLVLLIVIGVLFTACAAPVSAQTTATVSIGDVCAVPDSSVTVPIMVNNVTNLGSGTIDVYYNPEIVHVTDVESGAGNALVVQSWNVNNTRGLVQIAAWNTSGHHSGDVIFATVTCRAVASVGSTPLTIVVRNLKAYSDYPYPEIPYTVSNGTFTITPIVVINEFVSTPKDNQTSEWIEVYNPTGSDLALDGWTVEDNTGSTYTGQKKRNTGSSLSGYTVPAYGYIVLMKKTHFTFSLNNDGDIIVLKNGTTVVDNVAYGTGAASTADGGVEADNAPAPGHDESAGRFPNGVDTDNDRADFYVFDAPTPGAPNTRAPNITSFAPPSPVSNEEGESRTFTIAVDQVVNVSWQINGAEVGSTTGVTEASYTNVSAAIGIWNVSAIASNSNGTDMQTWIWNVTPVTGAQQPVTPFMIHGRVFENGTAWTNPAAVKIRNTNNSKQWYAETSAAYNYYQLVLVNGAALNVSEVLRFTVTTPDGSPLTTIEHTVTPDAIYTGGLFNVTLSLGVPAQPDVVINEFVSTPKDNQATEWIEVYNPTGSDLALDGWTVEDNTGSTYTGQKKSNTGSSLMGYTVPAYGYLVLTKGTHFNFALNDKGDIIVLKNGTTVVDNVAYGAGDASTADGGVEADNAPAPGHDESAGRFPNGMDTDNDRADFSVFDAPTPGAPNTRAPNITSFAPPSPVSNEEGESRTFTIAVDQVVNVSWQINGTEVGSTTGVTEASYTNVSATIGTWNVSAIASNSNGTDMQTWIWNVTLVTGAQQPVTPFMIHGRVFENGTAWNNPAAVKIRNTNNSKQWYAETSAAYNYYQLVLANGADLNVSEVLRFTVTTSDGSPLTTIEHTVTPEAIYTGGLFNVTLSFGVPAQPDIVINEFVSTPKDNQATEWIEVYNPTGSDLALDGWTVEDNTGSTYPGQTQGNTGSSLAGYTVPAYGYLVLTKGTHFNFALNDKGDIIVLKNGTTVVDNVAYGAGDASTADGGVEADNAPAPGHDKSAGRFPNGVDTDNDRADFYVFDAPTPGAPNTRAPTITSFAPPSPVSNEEGESRTFTIAVDQVVNVSWQINGTEVGSNTGVTEAAYTNVSAAIGTWNVSAIASNSNGTDMQTWWWTVKTSAPESRSLSAGWNLISTPTVLANNSWGNVTGLGDGLDYCIAYNYDPALGKWVQMKPNTQFKPLEAIFVKLNSPDVMEFIGTTDPLTVPPARELSKGWNLIGLNDMNEVKVDIALRSIEVADPGERGYISVYSPAYNSAEWTYTIGESPVPSMKPYEGYWVFMDHSDTLAGRII